MLARLLLSLVLLLALMKLLALLDAYSMNKQRHRQSGNCQFQFRCVRINAATAAPIHQLHKSPNTRGTVSCRLRVTTMMLQNFAPLSEIAFVLVSLFLTPPLHSLLIVVRFISLIRYLLSLVSTPFLHKMKN